MDWFDTPIDALGPLALTAVGIYAVMILFTRLAGLRSFSKMSSFDFAVTVAFGSVLATVIATGEPPLLQGAAALGVLYLIQHLVAVLRRRSTTVARLVDNRPLLLMAGSRILDDNLARSQVTRGDLYAKLREANVLSLSQVRAVVLETTGDVSVLHGEEDGPPLDPELLDQVRDAEEFRREQRADPAA